MCPTLCNPTDGSPSGSPIPGILQARTLERVAISFSNAWKWKVKVKLAQSCLTLHNPMDCSLPGSSIHGIFQAGVLERVALPSPKGTLEPSYTDTNGFKFFSWKSNRPQGMPGMWDRTGLLRAYLDQGRYASNISGITISTYWPNN